MTVMTLLVYLRYNYCSAAVLQLLIFYVNIVFLLCACYFSSAEKRLGEGTEGSYWNKGSYWNLATKED